jgi:isopentenyl phosphate kinase
MGKSFSRTYRDDTKRIRGKILDEVHDAGAFGLYYDGKSFVVQEECDQWHGIRLSREELLALATEIITALTDITEAG